MPFAPNLGECPPHARRKRVKVVLRNGMRPLESWPADGRFGCDWSLSNHPFDIVQFEVAG